MPPKKVVTISKPDMDRKFRDGGWEENLKEHAGHRQVIEDQEWAPAQGRKVLRKRGIKYLTDNRELLAIVFTYTLSDGTTRVSVRALSEGDSTFVVL